VPRPKVSFAASSTIVVNQKELKCAPLRPLQAAQAFSNQFEFEQPVILVRMQQHPDFCAVGIVNSAFYAEWMLAGVWRPLVPANLE